MDQMDVRENAELKKIVERLKLEFNPVKAILFGSGALGTSSTDSDFDLVIIVRSSRLSRIDRLEQARKALRDLNVSADVFIFTQAEFDCLKGRLSSIPETASNLGIELKVC